MAETAHTAWYRLGTVSSTHGSTTIIGNGTRFLSAGINQGATFRINGDMLPYEVAEVVSDTELTLRTPFLGSTAAGRTYSIDRNHQSTLPADLSARLAQAMGNWEARYDLDMATITGKSAYEGAVENGYVGTEADWLESLKAAGEWDVLDAHTKFISEVADQGEFRNCIYRGKNFGSTFTAAQLAQIQSRTFDDMYVGDRWTVTFPSFTGPLMGQEVTKNATWEFIIAGFNLAWSGGSVSTNVTKPHLLLFWRISQFSWPMNDTDTTEGGFVGSKMFQETLPSLEWVPESVFGEGHVLTYKDTLSSAVVDGKVTGYANVELKLNLCSDQQLTGKSYFSVEDGRIDRWFPYFRGGRLYLEITNDYKVRNVCSDTAFGIWAPWSRYVSDASNSGYLPIYFLVG